MDLLQFFSSIAGSLAWPLSVVWAIYLLRSPLSKLVPLITRVKYGELEVDLGSQLDDVKESIGAVSAEEAVPVAPPPLSFQDLAKADPRAAILSAWHGVQVEFEKLARAKGFAEMPTFLGQLTRLTEDHTIDGLTMLTIRDLRRIRNTAVHTLDKDVSYEDAIKMREACLWVSEQLQRINLDLLERRQRKEA